jgi:hypothetical protein
MISPIARFKTMWAGKKEFLILSALVWSVFFCYCGRSPRSVTVRGLYLGMPMNDAVKQVEAMYRQIEGSRFRKLQWRQWDSFSAHTDRATEMDITIRNSGTGIRFICFNPGLIDRLFDSASLSAGQLARRFAEEYRLSALEHRIDRNPPQPEHYWEYVSSRGWKVFITQAKALVLQNWGPQENEK